MLPTSRKYGYVINTIAIVIGSNPSVIFVDRFKILFKKKGNKTINGRIAVFFEIF